MRISSAIPKAISTELQQGGCDGMLSCMGRLRGIHQFPVSLWCVRVAHSTGLSVNVSCRVVWIPSALQRLNRKHEWSLCGRMRATTTQKHVRFDIWRRAGEWCVSVDGWVTSYACIFQHQFHQCYCCCCSGSLLSSSIASLSVQPSLANHSSQLLHFSTTLGREESKCWCVCVSWQLLRLGWGTIA